MASTNPLPLPSAVDRRSSGNNSSSPSNSPPPSHSSRVDVINSEGGRILCVADARGSLSKLNALAAEHNAVAIIHSGDFGFYEPASLSSISEKTLRHLVQYSSLISPQFRSQLLHPSVSFAQLKSLLATPQPGVSDPTYFGLSEFPKLLSGELRFNVPVYTVWGTCEDVAILERIRKAAPSFISIPSDPSSLPPSASTWNEPSKTGYSIHNLTVLDEATTRVLDIGGVKLRLFGLGGAVVSHKFFDNGTGTSTIAGGGGTMWTTILQVGEIVDTAQKVYDASETRLLVSHASPGREGLLSQLGLVLKADLSLSAGLHFRYGASYNEFSVQHDPEAFRSKLEFAKKNFNDVWDTVKGQVEGAIDASQKVLLANALSVTNRVPSIPTANGVQGAEENSWKNCWNWNMPDASYGTLVFDIRGGVIGCEQKSQGFNFAYRQKPAISVPRVTLPSSSVQPSVVPTGPSSLPPHHAVRPHQASGSFPSHSSNNHPNPLQNRPYSQNPQRVFSNPSNPSPHANQGPPRRDMSTVGPPSLFSHPGARPAPRDDSQPTTANGHIGGPIQSTRGGWNGAERGGRVGSNMSRDAREPNGRRQFSSQNQTAPVANAAATSAVAPKVEGGETTLPATSEVKPDVTTPASAAPSTTTPAVPLLPSTPGALPPSRQNSNRQPREPREPREPRDRQPRQTPTNATLFRAEATSVPSPSAPIAAIAAATPTTTAAPASTPTPAASAATPAASAETSTTPAVASITPARVSTPTGFILGEGPGEVMPPLNGHGADGSTKRGRGRGRGGRGRGSDFVPRGGERTPRGGPRREPSSNGVGSGVNATTGGEGGAAAVSSNSVGDSNATKGSGGNSSTPPATSVSTPASTSSTPAPPQPSAATPSGNSGAGTPTSTPTVRAGSDGVKRTW